LRSNESRSTTSAGVSMDATVSPDRAGMRCIKTPRSRKRIRSAGTKARSALHADRIQARRQILARNGPGIGPEPRNIRLAPGVCRHVRTVPTRRCGRLDRQIPQGEAIGQYLQDRQSVQPRTIVAAFRDIAMRWTVACVVALAAATAQSATGASITIHAERGGDTIDIRASAILQADSATAWRVLTEYERYTEFIPDLRSSRILARRGRTVTVEQSGDAALWLFRMPVDITFEINETPPSSLQSRAVAGSLRALTSNYALSPAASGIRLDYFGHIAPGFELFGQIEQTVVERNIARQFQALADEIERQSAAMRSHSNAEVK